MKLPVLERAMFNAPWWSFLFNPYYLSRRSLRSALKDVSHFLRGHTLDVGCGTQPYRSLYPPGAQVTGLEVGAGGRGAGKNADVLYDGTNFPFADGSVTSILCSQVLEHVFQPEAFIAEVSRVLEDDGILLVTVPFIWAEHEQPWDGRRYTSFGLRDFVERAGFDVLLQRKLVRGPAALLALAADRVHQWSSRFPALPRLMVLVLGIAPLSVLGVLLQRVAREDSALYLDNLLVARRRHHAALFSDPVIPGHLQRPTSCQ